MSIRDYSQKYVLVNGLTNEQITIPRLNDNKRINVDLCVNDFLLLQEILDELELSDSISIFKSYMKDWRVFYINIKKEKG